MILQQNGVEILDILGNRVGNLHGGGPAVLGDRHTAKGDDRFRHDGLGQRNACNGKAGGINRMSMYHASHIRPLLIHPHVHLNLRRRLEIAVGLNHIALSIHLADILRGHEALGHAGRGAKELIVIQLYGNVSVVGGNHVSVVDPPADVTDLFFDFILVLHFDSS